ncbi:MAG TPA: CRISPR-associated helicase Cas3' [Gemmataceae bacterium]|nr:CRISPR-associated helicase Cas3' [Gemmataceae bacterium]
MNPILAKSKSELTLVRHTEDVFNAIGWMFGIAANPTRLGRQWTRFFKLKPDQTDDFYSCLTAAAAFHDLGKACDSFEDAILHGKPQLIRHEHLSALMLVLEAVQAWLESAPSVHRNRDVILSAVLTHHLKARDPEAVAPRPPDQISFRLLVDRPDFAQLLDLIGRRVGLQGPRPQFEQLWTFEEKQGACTIEPLRERTNRRIRDLGRTMKNNPEVRRLVTAVRAALIAADAAASGLYREGYDLRRFLGDAFDESCLCDEAFVWERVINPRVDQLRRAGKWKDWSDFQKLAEQLEDRALLLEPCGAGKTLAAWRWMASRLRGARKAMRLIFLYPTRATATEGFRDYVSWAPEDAAGLMHGTADYDLEGMFENPQDPGDKRDEKDFETDMRLFAVGFWQKRVFSATVDQFLAFMQYSYGPVCMLPVLADSVVVIDEVHSFDQAMLSSLKCFLKEFAVPVLGMSATVLEERREQLTAECGLKPPSDARPLDLQAAADTKRYRLRRIRAGEACQRVRVAITQGKRVLWVVNQVKRAQQSILDLRRDWPAEAGMFCYHSRFTLENRRERHEEVVRAFQTPGVVALALTTQVCEMSLDLDADLLVTETCPITSLIQRMGRCHRSRDLRPGAGEILVYDPEDPRPYRFEHLGGLDEFLNSLCSDLAENNVSQSMLEQALKQHGPRLGEPDRWCAFTGNSGYAQGDESFRDIEEFTVPAVLAGRIPDFVALQQQLRSTAGLIVPIPRRWGKLRDPRLPKYLAVAPNDQYDPQTGFWDTIPPGGLES